MRTDKYRAFSLRRAGKSYNEICVELGMSKSTLSNWFRGVNFSEDIKKSLTQKILQKSTKRLKILNKTRGDALAAMYEVAEKEAIVELKKLKNDPLFVAAVAAYWGEGDKATKGTIRLANTDPKMIKLFMKFLTETCGVPAHKLRGALYLYSDLNETVCKRYWSTQTGIKQFHKTMILPSRHKTKRLPYGTCTVLITNTYLKKKLLLWIDQLPEMVLNESP